MINFYRKGRKDTVHPSVTHTLWLHSDSTLSLTRNPVAGSESYVGMQAVVGAPYYWGRERETREREEGEEPPDTCWFSHTHTHTQVLELHTPIFIHLDSSTGGWFAAVTQKSPDLAHVCWTYSGRTAGGHFRRKDLTRWRCHSGSSCHSEFSGHSLHFIPVWDPLKLCLETPVLLVVI